MQVLDQGNNEQISRGIYKTDAGFLAISFSQTKTFKTLAGAQKWLQKFNR